MSEEVKTKRTRRAKAEIKVSPIDYEKLKVYADSIKSKPDKIVEDLISEYFNREEVKAVLKDKEELIKLKEELRKNEEDNARIKNRIKEIEGSQK